MSEKKTAVKAAVASNSQLPKGSFIFVNRPAAMLVLTGVAEVTGHPLSFFIAHTCNTRLKKLTGVAYALTAKPRGRSGFGQARSVNNVPLFKRITKAGIV